MKWGLVFIATGLGLGTWRLEQTLGTRTAVAAAPAVAVAPPPAIVAPPPPPVMTPTLASTPPPPPTVSAPRAAPLVEVTSPLLGSYRVAERPSSSFQPTRQDELAGLPSAVRRSGADIPLFDARGDAVMTNDPTKVVITPPWPAPSPSAAAIPTHSALGPAPAPTPLPPPVTVGRGPRRHVVPTKPDLHRSSELAPPVRTTNAVARANEMIDATLRNPVREAPL